MTNEQIAANDAVLVPWAGHHELCRVESLTSEGDAFVKLYNCYVISSERKFLKVGTFRRTWYGGWKFVPLGGGR